jgi:hypothetical protein
MSKENRYDVDSHSKRSIHSAGACQEVAGTVLRRNDHAGQLIPLRRLQGSPVPPENSNADVVFLPGYDWTRT